MLNGRSFRELISPVRCEPKFHSGPPLKADRMVALRCPACEDRKEILVCADCYRRMQGRGLTCGKCEYHDEFGRWCQMDMDVKGPPTTLKA